MENLKRRGLSLLLALVMIVSLFAGIQLPQASAATVDYVYSGDYVYNWGTRGERADYLSPMAEVWWGNQTAYSELKEKSGSSNLDTVSTSALYIALADIMTDAHATMTTYDDTRYLYQYTDCQKSNTSKLTLLYLGEEVSSTWDGGTTFNREHTWPNSLSNSGSNNSPNGREADIMILYAADPTENSTRNNHPYGEGSGYYDPLYGYNGDDGTNTKRSLNVRGDVARAILYIYVRYGIDATYNDGALNYMWAEDGGVFQNLDTLLSWMESDPVDTWEMGRNDAVESITGTRNVFIDYPELAFLLFNESVPTGYTTPSGGKDVVSESYTVTIKENGVTTNTLSGNSVTLPQSTKTIDGYKFEGWVEAEVDKAESKPTVYAAGASYIPSKDTTLYALYSYSETTSGGDSSAETTYTISIADYASNNSWVNETQYTTVNLAEGLTVTAGGTAANAKYYSSDNSWRIYQSYQGTITFNSESRNIKTIKITFTKGNNGYLDYNGTQVDNNDVVTVNGKSATFTAKTTTSGKSNGQAKITAIEVVVAGGNSGGSATYYTTATCKHTNTSTVTTPASCTEAGSTTVTCKDCSTVISETTIPATGHNYVDGTCTVCGNSEPAESVQVVIYAPEYMMALSSTYSTESTNYNAGVEVTVSGSSVTGYDSTEVWTLTDNGDGTYSILYGDQYLCLSDSYTSMALCDPADDTVTHHHNWEIIPVGENLYNIRNTTRTLDGNTGYCIEWYAGNNYYCAYKTDTPYSNKNYQLSFHVVSGTLPTFTCEHAYVVTSTPGPSCTAYDEVKVCSKCGDKQTTEIPATTEHNMVAGTVVPPTATDYGYTLYHCDICGSYTEERDKVDPITGTEGITVTFVVPAGVAPISPMVTTDEGIELPTPGIPSADYEYTFAGWATSIVDNSTTAPTLYIGNYAPTHNVTLYAVYTYAPADNVFTRVDSTADLIVGNEFVITANDLAEYPYGMGAQKSSNRGADSVTVISDTTITIGENVQVFVLDSGTVANTYAFKSDDGYLYAASSSGNQLKTQSSNNGNSSWEITIDATTHAASVVATASSNRNVMQFNYNGGSPLFACYSSASQKALSLYTKSATVLTYTTEITRTEAYNVSFSTPSGVTAIPSTICGKTGITLPTAGVPANNHGYVFKGWATATYDNVTSKPTMYNPGEEFHATQDTTFYAVYEYTVAGGEESDYVLTDLSSISAADSVVITMTNSNGTYALTNGNGTSDPPAATAVTLDGTKLANTPAANLIWTIGGTENQYTFTPQENASIKLYCTNNNNGVRVGTGANNTFKIQDNYLYNNGQNRYLGVYNDQDWRSYTTINTNITGQTLAFYVKSTGTTYWTTEVEVIELKFYSASLEVGEGISINYKVAASLFAENLYDLDSVCATFVFNKETEDERTFTVSDPVLSGDYYVFQLKNIRPDWMGDVVTATLTATDANGESITSKAIKYSVAEYCYNKLNASDSTDALKTLLIDMLDYGAATQLHTGYKTDALVTDNAAYTNNAFLGTSSAPTLNAAPAFGTSLDTPTAAWKGAALFLRETVRIRLRFTAESIDGVTVTAQIGDNDPVVLDSFTSAGNNVYYVFFDNLLATQMREDVVFTVMQNGTAISNTLTYSVEAYATSATATAGTLADMLNAMMNYGDAVYAYAG